MVSFGNQGKRIVKRAGTLIEEAFKVPKFKDSPAIRGLLRETAENLYVHGLRK